VQSVVAWDVGDAEEINISHRKDKRLGDNWARRNGMWSFGVHLAPFSKRDGLLEDR